MTYGCMKVRSIDRYCHNLFVFSFVLIVCFTTPVSSRGNYIFITVPTSGTTPGTKIVSITPTGGKPVTVKVTVAGGLDADQTISAIVSAINGASIPGVTAEENAITLGNAVRVKGGRVTGVLPGTTAETDTVVGFAPTDTGPYFASIDLESVGGLAGLDSQGNPSSFTAGFALSSQSLGNIALSTSVSASQFGGSPTISGVLQQEYNNLSSELQSQAPSLVSDLSLNLARSEIDFTMPAGLTFESVTSGTTDIGGLASLSLVTPEPSTLTLLSLGSLGLLGYGWRRRKPKENVQ